MIKQINSYFLGNYKDANYVLQQKSKLILIILFIILLFVPVMVIIDIASGQLTLGMVLPLFGTAAVTILAIFFLKWGRFSIAAHTSIIIPQIAVWGAMFYLDTSPYPLCILDSIALVLGLMVLIPLVILKSTKPILIYTFINAVVFGVFVATSVDRFSMNETMVIDYVMDNGLAILFIGLISYQTFKINMNALKRAEELSDELTVLNRDLDIKVEQRTEELKVALDELEATNDQLVRARDSLWSEMQLAKKIQTVLLPDKPHIGGFEIAAYMEPADEVGGDYYDIINVKGYDWLVIGDVSGHGVPAGLIMMMVQTSIHTVLEAKPDAKPSELLVMINGVIYQNIIKLKEDKYMTITVLSCIKDGVFYHSGLHQDIMIFRAATSSVEILETSGMWIGLNHNLEGMVDDGSFKLEVGDTMLLYTDGITEARKGMGDNSSRAGDMLFGHERLTHTLERTGTAQLGAIKSAILDSLVGYRRNDDVTFMLVRRQQ